MADSGNDGRLQRLCRSRLPRILFYFLIIIFAALTIRDLTEIVKDYLSGKKKSNMNIIFNETMTFPNITFCMSKAQAWSHFPIGDPAALKGWDEAVKAGVKKLPTKEAFLNNDWDWRMTVEAYQVVGNLQSLEMETTVQGAWNSIQTLRLSPAKGEMRRMVHQWLEWAAQRNVSFVELRQKVGRETMRRSLQRFQRLDRAEARSDVKISWLSLMELCFQPIFHGEDYAPIAELDDVFVMAVSHNAQGISDEQIPCMMFDVHGSATKKARILQGKGMATDGLNEEICMGMEHEVKVEIDARYVTLPNSEPATRCKQYDEGDESQFDCQSRCRLETIRRMCECTPQSLAYLVDESSLAKYPLCIDYKHCGGEKPTREPPNLNVTEGVAEEQQCVERCFPDCTQIRYLLTHFNKGKSTRSDFTSLTMVWDTFEYLQLEQEWCYELVTFLAAAGGALGLWLGLCVLSLFQLTTFTVEKTTKQVVKKTVVSQASRKLAQRVAIQQLKPNLARPATVDEIAMAENPSSSSPESKAEKQRRLLSANPFGGPIAKNPFVSHFGKPARRKSGAVIHPTASVDGKEAGIGKKWSVDENPSAPSSSNGGQFAQRRRVSYTQ